MQDIEKIKPTIVPFKCPNCGGRGSVHFGEKVCHSCNGKGYILVPQELEVDPNKI